MKTESTESEFPEGRAFLDLLWNMEAHCSDYSAKALACMGEKAPHCLENIGTVVSLLYREACCFYGCAGGDHLIERLAARACSSTQASLRLLLCGYYDESFALTRSLWELGNLLFLFLHDPKSFEKWRQSSKSERNGHFSAVNVRRQLEALGLPVPVQQDRYAALCETAIHVTPNVRPQAHNPLGRPMIGPLLQEGGALVALNELGGSLCLLGHTFAALLPMPESRRALLKSTSRKLLESLGSLTILNIEDVLREVRKGKSDNGPIV
jgi:hypothetical protein